MDEERFDTGRRVEQQERRAALQEGIKEFADSAREATAEARQLSQILKCAPPIRALLSGLGCLLATVLLVVHLGLNTFAVPL